MWDRRPTGATASSKSVGGSYPRRHGGSGPAIDCGELSLAGSCFCEAFPGPYSARPRARFRLFLSGFAAKMNFIHTSKDVETLQVRVLTVGTHSHETALMAERQVRPAEETAEMAF